jgi:hypothetical protein
LSPDQEVSHLIERLEAFEDRLGVRLEGLFAQTSDSGHSDHYYLSLNGELHSNEGTELNDDVEIVATMYDPAGRVINIQGKTVRSGSFFGFRAFRFFFQVNRDVQPAKIRVYPQIR